VLICQLIKICVLLSRIYGISFEAILQSCIAMLNLDNQICKKAESGKILKIIKP